MNNFDLSVVIPTFRELENIRVLCPWIARVTSRAGLRTQIVVVDDDTADGTEQWARSSHDWISDRTQFRFISRRTVRGLVTAWQHGVSQASADTIVIMDADLCHDPDYLPIMFKALAGHDMIIGSRYLPGRLAHMPDKNWLAVVLSRLAQHLCRFVLRLPYRDLSHSFRMFRRCGGADALQRVLCRGNAAMVEHIYLLHQAGGRIAEIPVSYGKRIHGKTKLRVGREGLGLLGTLLRLRFRRPDNIDTVGFSYEQA
ncbi:MAG: glycosyltransferase [Actinobacteria bacterium]|nr:glycosyltransferase [Actinomycetota bacterium]